MRTEYLSHIHHQVFTLANFMNFFKDGSTLVCISIQDIRWTSLLPDLSDDFICEVATTPQEIIKLITNGYEKITEMNGQQFFRKRK